MSHPKKPTDIGMNRTGIATSPLRAAETVDGADEGSPENGSYGAEIARFRAELSQGAPPLGSVPPPGTVKGVVKTAMQALQGHKANVFLDKLAERLAFERSGVRLYDALLSKVPAAKKAEGTLTAEALRRHREDELRHMHVVREAIEHLGGDPTAMTPCADLVGVQGQGLLQALSDPRTTLTQGLDTILAAELIDNDGWKMLIAMAEGLGQTELAKRFTIALTEEDQHLADVRKWLAERLELQLGAKLPSAEFGDPVQP